MILELSKIESLKRGAKGSYVGRCPACAQDGRDKSGNHLIIYANGKYGCAANKEDKEHTNLIYQLIGKNSTGSPSEVIYVKEPDLEEPEIIYPESKLNALIDNHDYWINRGVKESTIKRFRGGLAVTQGKLVGRYVFPIFNPDGQIHGWTGRTLKTNDEIEQYDIKKYKHLGPTSKFIYPLFLNKKSILENNWVVLTEGHGDILALFDNNLDNSLELFGTHLSSNMLGALVALNPAKIVIATNNEPDNENIGNDAAQKIKQKLLGFFDKSQVFVHLPFKKDFGDMTREEISQWHEQALKL